MGHSSLASFRCLREESDAAVLFRVGEPSLSLRGATRIMTKNRRDGLVLLLLGAAIFLLVGLALKRISPISSGDFKVVYYPARCLLQHGDPYLQGDVERVYQAEGRELPSESALNRQVMTQYFYPPTAFVVTLPFALLGYGPGHVLWMIVSAGSLVLAAFLMFDLAAEFSPLFSGVLLGFLLMNSFWLFIILHATSIGSP